MEGGLFLRSAGINNRPQEPNEYGWIAAIGLIGFGNHSP